MKTMYKGVVNSPETFLKENLVQGATIMYVADGSVFGTLPTLAVIGDDESAETVLVESVDSGAYTIKRAFEGTAKDWTKGTTVARNFTNYDYQAVIDNIDELSKRKIPSKLSELTDDSNHRLVTDAQRKAWDDKVDKVSGKGLSTNDFTDKDRAQIAESMAKIDSFNQYTQKINAKADQALINNAELDNKKADRTEIKTKLSEMIDDSTHRTVTDSEKSTWNGKLSSISGQDVSRAKTKGYGSAGSWQSVSNSRDVEDWIGDFDKRTRENKSNMAKKSDIVDFKRCIVLTQTEYNNLSSTEKNRTDTLYFIKE